MINKEKIKKKLTKSFIESLTYSESGQNIFRDTELKGFGLKVSRTSKSFFVEKRVSGKNIRKKIGGVDLMLPEQARKEALRVLGEMAQGVNPIEKAKALKAKSITLQQAFKEYLDGRELKPSTIRNMNYMMNQIFKNWFNVPLNDINRDMVLKLHKEISKTNGKIHSDNAMRCLRSIFNYSIANYTDSKADDKSLIRSNPVIAISATKTWHKKKRRQTRISDSSLPVWFEHVLKMKSSKDNERAETVRDYLLVLLLTGLRKNEAAKLTWNNINLENGTMLAEDTKNGTDHTLYLSDILVALLSFRKSESLGPFVFDGVTSHDYIKEPKRQIQNVIASSGIKFMIHDLKRNFVTAAALELPYYTAKRLINHKISESDVTDGYVALSENDLRMAMQKVTDYFMMKAQLDKSVLFDFYSKN